jgi:phosphoglycolate phosphatase
MIKAVIFDWNGVIMDDIGAVVRADLEIIHFLGGEKLSQDIWFKELGQDWKIFFTKYGVKKQDLKKSLDMMGEYYSKHKKYIKLTKNMKKVLDFLAENKIKIGVCSSNNRDMILTYIHQFSLEKYFSFIVGGDDVKHSKPHPESLIKSIKASGAKANDILYVDDMGTIFAQAKKLGLITIGFKSKISRDLESADYVTDNALDIIEIIKNINKKKCLISNFIYLS